MFGAFAQQKNENKKKIQVQVHFVQVGSILSFICAGSVIKKTILEI